MRSIELPPWVGLEQLWCQNAPPPPMSGIALKSLRASDFAARRPRALPCAPARPTPANARVRGLRTERKLRSSANAREHDDRARAVARTRVRPVDAVSIR